jgi:hypothetical protein
MLTICHAHAEIVETLPICERVLDSTTAPVVFRVEVILQEMPNQELGPALGTQKETQAERVEEDPRKCMNEVQGEDSAVRGSGKEREGKGVEQHEEQHGVARPGIWANAIRSRYPSGAMNRPTLKDLVSRAKRYRV